MATYQEGLGQRTGEWAALSSSMIYGVPDVVRPSLGSLGNIRRGVIHPSCLCAPSVEEV